MPSTAKHACDHPQRTARYRWDAVIRLLGRQVKRALWGRREHTRTAQRHIQCSDIVGAHLNIGINVDARGNRGQDGHRRLGPSRLEATGSVTTRTGGPNDAATAAVSSVQPLANMITSEPSGPSTHDLPEQAADHPRFVMSGNHDSDRRAGIRRVAMVFSYRGLRGPARWR